MPITTHIMRTIGFRSNILFAIAAAVGVIAALGRPWYAPGRGGRRERRDGVAALRHRAARSPSPTGRTGWDSFTQADTLIAGLAIATVALLVLAMLPAIQLHVQALARWTGLATFGVVLVKFFDEPGANAARRAPLRPPDRAPRRRRARRERDDRRRGAEPAPDRGAELHAAAGARARARVQLGPYAVLKSSAGHPDRVLMARPDIRVRA